MQTVLFYSSVKSKSMFSVQSFYKTDIDILQQLGYRVKLSNRCADFLRFWEYDIAFIYFYRYGLFAALFAALGGKRRYFTGGIDYLDKHFATKKQRAIQRLFFKCCHALATHCILVSNSDKRNVAQIYGGKMPRKCSISHHVFDVEALQCTTPFANRQKRFCTIAWMQKADNVHRKGIDTALHTFAKIRQTHPEYDFYIAGPMGEGSDIVQDIARQLHLENAIHLLGAISEAEKIRLLQTSMFYFQLSIYEGFGIAAAEALAAGTIVVHSGRGGLQDAVGNFGLLCPSLQPDDIAKQLLPLLDATPNNSQMEQGVEYTRKNFTFTRRFTDFEKIIGRAKSAQ